MKAVLVLAAFLSATTAYAHGPASGPNGGPQVDAGDFHIEAVAQGTSLAVYVRDAGDKPVPTDGFKGTAIFVVDGKPQRIVLAPGGENRLTGTSTAPLTAPKGAVQISTSDGKSIQGKFE
jgi:hypothetical protein